MDIQNVPLTVRTVRTLSYVVAAPGNATSQAQQAVGEFVQMSCLDSKNHNSSSVQNNSTTCRNIEEEDSEDSPEPLSPRVRRSALRRTLAAGDECPKTGDWKGQCWSLQAQLIRLASISWIAKHIEYICALHTLAYCIAIARLPCLWYIINTFLYSVLLLIKLRRYDVILKSAVNLSIVWDILGQLCAWLHGRPVRLIDEVRNHGGALKAVAWSELIWARVYSVHSVAVWLELVPVSNPISSEELVLVTATKDMGMPSAEITENLVRAEVRRQLAERCELIESI